MLLDDNICLDTVYTVRVIGYLITIAKILIPIIIIVSSIVPFFDAVVKGNDKGLSEASIKLLKKIGAGIIILIVPTIINALIEIFVKKDYSSSFYVCKECMYEPGGVMCKNYVDAYDAMLRGEEIHLGEDGKIEGKVDLNTEENNNQNEEQNNNEEKEGNEGNTTEVSTGEKNIIIGDSRTVGMCAEITGSYSGCTFSGSARINNNDYFIAKGSQGYTWFNSTAVPAVNNLLNNSNGITYNIYSLMGVNYLLSDIDKYITKYNSLASGDWSKHNIILVSVTPVNEEIVDSHGYKVKNANIETFNSKLKNGVSKSNVKYCDIYNQIKNNFSTSDGLHYAGSTYRNIYNLMMKC